ncbi:MAG: hypothetical protein CUN56_05045 [Phototrophicales bacterium]|nr:MAG: hypothetical protein CUN56_05045 [Phototrophicales bacterium]RMG73408.1 MAG: hypothetical protein D6711_10870 [Chloroflexota bacterium]
MAKQVKMVVFILERGPGYEAEGVLSRSEAEWEMAKLLSDGWQFMGAGGGNGAEDLGAIGLGFALFSKDATTVDDSPLMS